jgi:hypothetical protein
MDADQNINSTSSPANPTSYPARLNIDYPVKLDRLTTFFRLFTIIPIAIVFGLIASGGETVRYTYYLNQAGQIVERSRDTTGGIMTGLFLATLLMILFVQRYPRWWFDFSRELVRFAYRVGAYFALLTDQYPSTVEEQAIHLELDYPDAKNGLNRWMPLIKWFLAIPHYVVLAFLITGSVFAVIFAWFAIVISGQYPKGLFDYMVGVGRWVLRVDAYAFLLITDQYPPFSLQ